MATRVKIRYRRVKGGKVFVKTVTTPPRWAAMPDGPVRDAWCHMRLQQVNIDYIYCGYEEI